MSGQGQALRTPADARQPGVPGARRRDGRDRAAPRGPDRAGLSADRRPDRDPPAHRHPRGARQGRLRVPGVPARARSPRQRTSCRSPGRSRRRTSRRRSRVGTLRCAGSPSTSSWRSSSGMVGAAPAARPRRGAGDPRRCRRRCGRPVGDRRGDRGARRRADRPDRRPGRRHGRHPRRPRPADADAAPPPGRRRVGQDRGRGLRPRGDRPGRLPGRAPGPDRPAGPPAPRDGQRRCSRGSASASRC